VLAWWAALVLGFALRAVPVIAARPYIAYVDEGHFLHPAFRMIRDGAWDPRQFAYPQLPRVVVAAVGRIEDAICSAAGKPSLRERISYGTPMYDELEPFSFLATARVLSVVAGLGIVVLTGLFGQRLAGPVAGAAAALLAACTPALVLRGSIATVDSYAALAAIAALSVIDLGRASRTPEFAALGAGALAGAAFASKYPAVLVFVAFGATTLLLPSTAWDRVRRLFAGVAGLVVGIFAAMPALWRHAVEIRSALLDHWSGYHARGVDDSLWRQALVQAESNLQHGGPELGIAFCLLALTGVVVGLGQRELRPTISGWCAFAAAMFLLFGGLGSRPFRNLLPLVPVGCVAAGIGYAWVRSRASRPAAVDAAGVILLVFRFVLPMAAHAKRRFDLVDPRRAAIDWLAQRAMPVDTTAYLRELAILGSEVARVPGKPVRLTWDQAPDRIRAGVPRFVVGGVLMRPDGSWHAAARWPELSDYRPVFEAGKAPTPPFGWWRGNDEIVVVFERKAPR
jgi:hypothetical protein